MRISISKKSEELINQLTSLYGFKTDSIIARICFLASLQNEKRYDLNAIPSLDRTGKDFLSETNLFGSNNQVGSNFVLYKTVLDQHYDKNLSEEEFKALFNAHLQDGLQSLSDRALKGDVSSGIHFSVLMDLVRNGLNLLSSSGKTIFKTASNEVDYYFYDGLVDFNVGIDEKGENVSIRLNDLNRFDSHHIAIAGMTGSGKTQLLKDILYQISVKTNNKLKFIFFDYKGEGDPENIKRFLGDTGCDFIDILKGKFELNPLSFIDSKDPNERNFQINAFVDSIGTIETSIGTKQKHTLISVIRGLFDENGKEVPTLSDIYSRLVETYEISRIIPDTLLAIIDKLASGLFANGATDKEKIFNKSIYLNLPITLSDTLRQLIVFLTLKYLLSEFSKANDTEPDENRIKPLRYIIVIDEAHVYLKNKNASKALEELLRVIRSKGVVVILLTQGIEDFKTKNFDFASQIKIPLCLNVKNKNDFKLMKDYLGSVKSDITLKSVISKLDNGYAVINISEPKLVEINQLWKRFR